MDLSVYEKIIDSRGQDSSSTSIIHGRTLAKQQLRQDLIKGKAVWVNERKWDYWSYVRINHELISVLFAPAEHPFGRGHRFIIFLSHICISLFFSAFASVMLDDASLGTRIFYSIWCSVCTSIATNFTKCCLVCQCIDNAPAFCRKCVKCCGMQFVNGMICYSLFLLGLGIFLIEITPDETTRYFLFIFILSTCESYLTALAVNFILFELEWRKEHKLAQEGKLKSKKKYCITFVEYMEWKEKNGGDAGNGDAAAAGDDKTPTQKSGFSSTRSNKSDKSNKSNTKSPQSGKSDTLDSPLMADYNEV